MNLGKEKCLSWKRKDKLPPFLCLSVCLSVCLLVCLSVSSVCFCQFFFFFLSDCLSLSLSLCPSLCLSIWCTEPRTSEPIILRGEDLCAPGHIWSRLHPSVFPCVSTGLLAMWQCSQELAWLPCQVPLGKKMTCFRKGCTPQCFLMTNDSCEKKQWHKKTNKLKGLTAQNIFCNSILTRRMAQTSSLWESLGIECLLYIGLQSISEFPHSVIYCVREWPKVVKNLKCCCYLRLILKRNINSSSCCIDRVALLTRCYITIPVTPSLVLTFCLLGSSLLLGLLLSFSGPFQQPGDKKWQKNYPCLYYFYKLKQVLYIFSEIVQVRVVFRKTVVGDWHFEYLSGSHLQSQVQGEGSL